MPATFRGQISRRVACGPIYMLGLGVGVGLIFASFIQGIARQPELEGKLMTWTLVGAAIVEGIAIFAAIMCFLLSMVSLYHDNDRKIRTVRSSVPLAVLLRHFFSAHFLFYKNLPGSRSWLGEQNGHRLYPANLLKMVTRRSRQNYCL